MDKEGVDGLDMQMRSDKYVKKTCGMSVAKTPLWLFTDAFNDYN